MLYPLKFKAHFKERIWGGDTLRRVMGKNLPTEKPIGESWEISSIEGDISEVANGCLRGNNLQELIDIYKGDLVGEHIFKKYGHTFPVLIKLIDAQDVLSIQVHPDDRLARERHDSYGKTEMWYIIDARPGACIYLGFNREVTREMYLEAVRNKTLVSLLNKIEVKSGDAYFVPAGAIHAIGKGLLIAEIQQTSDITYRVYDWDRLNSSGVPRSLHTELAVDAIDFGPPQDYNVTVHPRTNVPVQVKSSPYFMVNLIEIEESIERDYSKFDSFVIYMCLAGDFEVHGAERIEELHLGESILISAEDEEVVVTGSGKILEIFMP